jgi:hypothetical protein
METLVDASVGLMVFLCVALLAYGAWLCLPPFQRKRSADEPAPTSFRKRVRSISERLSASSR